MRIVDLLKKQSIDLNASVADKAAAIDHLVDLMAAGGNLNDKELYKQRVLAREQEGSTGIGEGIAIPHAKTEAVNEPGLASMIVRDGVDYESLDDEPAHLFFLKPLPKKHRLKRKRPLRRIVPTSSASQPARRALPTPTWQQKPWKTKPLPWASTSKSKRMVPAVSRTT